MSRWQRGWARWADGVAAGRSFLRFWPRRPPPLVPCRRTSQFLLAGSSTSRMDRPMERAAVRLGFAFRSRWPVGLGRYPRARARRPSSGHLPMFPGWLSTMMDRPKELPAVSIGSALLIQPFLPRAVYSVPQFDPASLAGYQPGLIAARIHKQINGQTIFR